MFPSLIYNAALLLALGIVFDAITVRSYRQSWVIKILAGISLGFIALAIMTNPWILRPGIVFDTRSILLSLTGMFFGLTPTIIAMAIAATFRIIQGGAGVYMGVSVIIASVCCGFIWKKLHRRWKHPYSFLEFYTLGIATHVTMLSLTRLLPASQRMNVLTTIALPVMFIYPLATVLLGQLLVRRMQIRQERLNLKHSEQQFRSLYENAPMPYQSLDAKGCFVSVNKAWQKDMGYEPREIIGKNFADVIHPDYRQYFFECFSRFKEVGHIEDVEHVLIKKDGSQILTNFSGVIVTNEVGDFLQTQCVFTDVTEKKKAELILAESEERYRLLAETAQDIILVHHFDSTVSYANKKALSFLGVKPEELSSLSIMDYIPEEYRSMLAQHSAERKQGFLGSRLYQMELFNSEKSRVQVEVSSTPIIVDNQITGIIAVIRDISERLADQIAIKESQERFEMFMDNLPGGVFIKDSYSTVLYVNKYLRNVHSAERKVGSRPHSFYPKDIANAIVEEDQQTILNGTRNVTEEILHNDGSLHIYDTTKFVLPTPHGEPLIGGIALDVTQKMQAEEQRNRYAHRLEILRKIDSIVLETLSFESVCIAAVQSLHELIPFTVLTVNVVADGMVNIHTYYKPDNRYNYLNSDELYPPNTEYLRELIQSKTIIINDASEVSQPQDMPVRAALIADGIQSFMYNAMIMQDELVGFLWFSSEQKDFFTPEYKDIADEFADQLAIVLHHLQLIQRIKEHAAELEQKVEERTKQLTSSNRELEAFSYSVAHDLRSPLRTIDGYCNILIEDYTPSLHENALQLLCTIRDTSHRMDTLIKELLELAKLTRNTIQYTQVNMYKMASQICKDILDSYAPIQFDVVIDALPGCSADYALIRQVWQNLLENAAKFSMPCATRQIHIGYHKREHDTVYYVQDSGVGFNMEFVNKIFDAFQRLHRDTEFEGTGIGLAIVKKIIDRHLGDVWAESTIGTGSTLYFSLPDEINED